MGSAAATRGEPPGGGDLGPAFGASRTAPPVLARRSRDEIARSVSTVEADLRIATDAVAIGPAALERATAAAAQARSVQTRLRRARDLATTLAAIEHHPAVR